MYQSNTIRQCLWLIATIRQNGRLTLKALQEKWTADSTTVKDRIVLENVPEGEQFLPVIIKAIRLNRRLHMRYQRFGCEVSEKTVEPYVLKLWGRRWYLLVFTGHHMATYSLDRMLSVEMTDETFVMPDTFSSEQFFGEYYGVLTDETTPLTHAVVRAYGKTANYLRTLPLHHSQRVKDTTEAYTDFSYDIRPTPDFIGELLKYDQGLEVVDPPELRLKICKIMEEMLNRY